jgi:nicotinamide-nucleotide amidase
VKAEIITIGDELLIGQIVNTNAAHIGRELSSLGIQVTRETTVGDEMKAILAAFRLAWKESDVVIVTGGLGPTHDDISKAAVAKFFRKKLTLHQPTLKSVKARFAKLGYSKMPEVNVGQAMVPQDFRVLRNERGTAPGLLYHHTGKTFVIVAGVPQEMEYILETGIIPFLRKTYRGKLESILHRTLSTIGIGESMLAEKIGDPKSFLGKNTTLAFLPRAGGVRLRISTRTKTASATKREIERVENILRERAGKYIYGADDEPLESQIVKLLTEQHKTLSTAESCTGGLIASKITEVSGSSAVFSGAIVAYDNQVKIDRLGVKPELLRKFGAVSEEVAIAMAEGGRERLKTDFAIGITGIAGPDGGTPEKPVGTIWLALAEKGQRTLTKKLQLDFGRAINRERSANASLDMLRRRLRGEA